MFRRNFFFQFVAVTFFFIAALIALLFITLRIRNYTISGEKVEPAQVVEVYLERAGGLTGARPVFFMGMNVGTVDYVSLVKDGPYKNWAYVHLKLNQKIPLYEDASAAVRPSSFLGNPYIELFSGNSARKVLSAPIYRGEAVTPIFEALNLLIDENREEFQEVFEGFQDIAKKFSEGEGTLQKLMNEDSNLFQRMQDLGDQLSETLEKSDQGSTRLFSKEFRDDLEKLNQQLDLLTETFQDTEKSSLGAFMSEAFQQKAENTFDRFSLLKENLSQLTTQIREGNGVIPQLLAEKSPLASAFQEAWEKGTQLGDAINQLGDRFSQGKAGLFSALGDDDIRQTYEQIAENLNGISHLIEAGEGSLAKLYQDEILLEKTKRCLRQLSEIGEDRLLELPIHSLLSQLMSNLIP